MRRGKEQLFHKIFILAGQGCDAAAAAALRLIRIRRLPLDVACVRQREHAFLLGDEILNIHFAGDMGNLGTAVIAVLFTHGVQLILHHLQHLCIVGQNAAPVVDLRMQVAQFVLYFQNLKARQLAQLEIDDGCCLRVVKTEFFHDGGFCLGLPPLHARIAAMISSTMSTARRRPSRI